MLRRLLVPPIFLVVCLGVARPGAGNPSADPISAFIAHADSIAKAGGDAKLTPYVVENSILVGAVVGRLLDVGFDAGDGGDKTGEKENLALALRIARLHRDNGGSAAPMHLAETFEGWDAKQRETRKRAKALEADAVTARDAGEYDRSLALYRQAMELYRQIDDRYSIAVTWGSLGILRWYRGEMDAVMDSYRQALAARREIEDRILEGKTLIGLGGANTVTGNYEEAIDYYRQATELCRKTGDLTYLGTSLNYTGATYYQMGDLIKARDAFEEALPVLEKSGNQAKMVEILINIANYYNEMGRSRGASDAYRRAIEIAKTVGQPQDEAAARMNLADNLRAEGRYRDALRQLEATQTLLKDLNEPIKRAKFLRIRGFTYMDMGEMDQARDDLLAYLKLSESLSDPFYRTEALICLGQLYSELGAYERGLSVADEARALAEESEQSRLVRDATVLAEEMLFSMARYDEAMQLLEDAIEMDRQIGSKSFELEENIRVANIHAATGKMAQARAAYRESLAIVRESGIDLERTLQLNIGHTFENENPDSAIYHYEKALEIVEQRRASIGGVETRTGFFSGKRRYFYEEVARFYASLDEGGSGEGAARAFHTIERAKARGLLDLLESVALAETDPIEEALLDSLYQIGGESAEARRDRRRLERRYQERREERLSSSVGALGVQNAIVTIPDVQAVLPGKTVLLEYALGDTASFLWVIDRKSFELVALPNRRDIRSDVEQLRDAITQPGAGDAALRRTARGLYQKLVFPAESRIKKAKSVVIVPDGVLFELPFEVLISAETDKEQAWKDVPFMTRMAATAYAPSASVYVKLLRAGARKANHPTLLAVGDPDFSVQKGSTGTRNAAFSPLPYSRTEIQAIGSHLGDDEKIVLLGRDASEAKLKEDLRHETPAILHLATHGLVDPVDPAASCVVLTPDPEAGEDGLLHTLEILEMHLDGCLVVASACESARGRVGRGEGVVGLSRAFIASGANGVVASLWPVSDKSTSKLMEHFYERMLDENQPASAALREARLALMKDPAYAHPFYWSPFVVIGGDGPSR
jgi:CHAT domain-containing protein/Tfp pilus assembly protein PilF